MRIALAVVLFGLVACDKPKSNPDAGSHDPPIDAGVDGPPAEHKDIPVTVNRDLDILFVVDDSPSMADKQANLRANFPNFINVLNTLPGGLPNLHLGVITTDVGSKGEADAAAGPSIGSGPGACIGTGKAGNLQLEGASGMVSGTFISDIKQSDGSRMTNYTGSLSSVFSAMANAGTAGCGFEQPLASVKLALGGNVANAGFLRSSALLAIVFLTDEDDCSIAHSTMLGPETPALGALQSFRCTRFGVICDQGGTTSDEMNQIGTKAACHSNESSPYLTSVASYVQFVRGLKSNPSDVIVAALAAVPTPVAVELRAPPGGGTSLPALAHSCTYTDAASLLEVGDPAVRLGQFLDGFPNRSSFTTVCQQDLSGGLAQIAQLITSTIGTPCFENTLKDIDPNTPGVQFGCTVADVLDEGLPNQTTTPIAACDATESNKPCWHIVSDVQNCVAGDHLALKIERTSAPPPDDHIVADCLIP